MNNVSQQVNTLLMQAENMSRSDAKVQLLQEAVKLADAHNLETLAFEARQKLVDAATFAGHAEMTLLHFPWLLAKCDQDPEKFKEQTILWKYKWAIASLPEFPSISKEKIMAAMQDMEARFRKHNYKVRTIHEYYRILGLEFGDLKMAEEAQEKFLDSEETTFLDRFIGMANCKACEINNQVTYYLEIGNPDKALEVGAPILREEQTCENVPKATFSKVLLPLLEAGALDQAAAYFQRGLELTRDNRNFIIAHSQLLNFLVWTGNLEKGLKFLEQHAHFGEESRIPREQLEYLKGGWNLCQALTGIGQGELKIRIPRSHPLLAKESPAVAADLARDYLSRARELALAFDRRNGNDFEHRKLEKLISLKDFRVSLEI